MKNKNVVILSTLVFLFTFGFANLLAQEVKSTDTKTSTTTDQVVQEKETSKENVSSTTIDTKDMPVQTTTDINKKDLRESNPELYKQMKMERKEKKQIMSEEKKERIANKEQHQMEMKEKKEKREEMKQLKESKDSNIEAPQVDVQKETTDDSTEK